MRKNLHSFSPGSSAMMLGLRVHSSENEQKQEGHRHSASTAPTEETVPAEQVEETPPEVKLYWRPMASVGWRFARR
jgi:hypothetical protein